MSGDSSESSSLRPSSLHDLVEEFLLYLASVRGLSANTVTAYRSDLSQLTDFLGDDTEIRGINVQMLRDCIGRLSAKGRSAASVNRFIASVRTLFSYCRKFQYIRYNPALELHTVKIPKHMPRFMTEAEVDALCSQPCRRELLWETRDKAIFEMLYSSGCRVSELASLRIQDMDGDFSSAVVTGKGKKDRRVYFEADARQALAAYLADRAVRFGKLGTEDTVEALFVNQRGGPLSVYGITMIVSRYSGPEGTNHHVSPHAFRHTFATEMLTHGTDIRAVQEMLGHASIGSTQIYTSLDFQHLAQVYDAAHPHAKKK